MSPPRVGYWTKGCDGSTSCMQEKPEQHQAHTRNVLPVVERIDPALVPEFFWRDVASRPSVRQSAHDQRTIPRPI